MPTVYNINKRLNVRFSKMERAFQNVQGSVNQRMWLAHQTALKDIGNQIEAVYTKWGDNPSITQVRKFNRLTKIEAQLAERFRLLDRELHNITSSSIKSSLTDGFTNTVNGINEAFAFNFTDATFNTKGMERFLDDTLWSDSMKNNTAKLWTDTKRNFETVLRANAREEVLSGVAQGKSYTSMMKDIRGRFDVSYVRSKTIAFTEGHKAHSYSRNESLKEVLKSSEEVGLEANKVWRHNGVGIPREDHVAANGQVANKKGFFGVGGESLEAPGLGTRPENNINCHCSAEFEIPETKSNEKKLNTIYTNKKMKPPDFKAPTKFVQPGNKISEYEKLGTKKYNNQFEDNYRKLDNHPYFEHQHERVIFDLDQPSFDEITYKVNSNMTKHFIHEEIVTVAGYTDEMYMPINSYLSGGTKGLQKAFSQLKPVTSKGIDIIETYQKNLTRVLEKVDNYQGNVQRYIKTTDRSAISYYEKNIGKDISWKGFSSTGKKGSGSTPDWADIKGDKDMAGILFKIKSKTGKDIQSFSAFPDEKEVLFLPDTKFKIIKIVKDKHSHQVFLEEL